jgi:chromosome segregation ATPase
MWNLELELIAILLTAAIIGLLMGRFLCKSGEAEEKAKKASIITAYKALEIDFKKSEERLAEQVSLNHEYADNIAEQEQNILNLETKLSSSDKHSSKCLEELKVLEKYKTRFEALSREFNLQVEQIETLKGIKSTNIETIDGFETSSRILEQNFSSLSTEHAKTSEILEHVSTLSKEQQEEIDKLKNAKIERNERLEFLEKEYPTLVEKLNISIADRDDLMARIRAISSVVGAVGVEES